MRAIVRERVDRRFDRAWDVPLTIVVGPAGAGKTTAAAHLVDRSRRPAVWYRAHPVDGDEAVFCEHLSQAMAHAIGGHREWADLAALVFDAGRIVVDGGLLIVVDEFDAVIGTDTEQAIGAVLADLAPSIHVMTLSRHRPSFNVTRLRLGPGVGEVGPDDLRFRSWEVDRLFRELYGRPLLPDEVVELERKTGGWVAALQLFDMATTRLPAGERRAAIAHVGRRAGPDWDFLADNVLSGLPDELQLFLLETAPLERLTAPLCDELLHEHVSWHRLAELDRLQLVTSSMEAPGSFRAHEVLRSHLEGLLVEWEGPDAVRKRFRHAAETLERHEQFTEALRAYCRGEDWSSAGRLLGARGAEVADRPGSWLVGLPPALVHSDPWLQLAVARQHRGEGRVAHAIAAYQRVESTALTSVPVAIARRERLLLASLVDRSSPPSLAWVAALRDAVLIDPNSVIESPPGHSPHDLFSTAIAHLLAGEVATASELLHRVRDRPDASPTLSLAAGAGLLVASYLAGTASADDADDLEHAASGLDVPFLSRLCRAAAGMVHGSIAVIDSAVDECDRVGDAAGAAAAAVLATISAAWSPQCERRDAADALTRCREVGSRTLEVWVQVADAFGRGTEHPEADGAAAAELAARRRNLRALQSLAAIAVALGGDGPHAHASVLAIGLRDEFGLSAPRRLIGGDDEIRLSPDVTGGVEIRCFGRFRISRNGTDVDLSRLRPRARAVLRMLAVHIGGGVHRQVLCDELWPTDDEATAAKKLQVSISLIRRAIDADHRLVRRDGDVYLLDPARGADCDVHRFTTAIARSRSLLADGDADGAASELREALHLYHGEYHGELLPEEGATEWVIAQRHHFQAVATEASRTLAVLLLDAGLPADAIDVCRTGLRADRYADPLWRLLLTALRADGDHAGHAVAVSGYDEVLAELGVERAT